MAYNQTVDPYTSPNITSKEEIEAFLEELEDTTRSDAEEFFGSPETDLDILDELLKWQNGSAETDLEDLVGEDQCSAAHLKFGGDLEKIAKLREIVEDLPQGESLIAEDYFETYAREFANDIGAIKDDEKWPYTCINWEKAAEDLQQDFTTVEIDGTTYYYRDC